MAHNSYTRSGGIWNIGTSLLAAEMASLDAKTFAAINGDAGGTWAPSSLITIGGAGVAMTTSVNIGSTSSDVLTVDAASEFNSQATFQGIQVFGSSTFHDNLTIGTSSSRTLTVNATSIFAGITGTTAAFSGTVNLNHSGTLGTSSSDVWEIFASSLFFGGASFSSGISSDTLDVSGPSALHGVTCTTLAASSGISATSGSFSAPVTFSGTGRVIKRVITSTSASITGIGPKNCDVLVITALGGDGFVTIDNTGAQDGDEMRIVNLSSTHFTTVLQPDGVTTIISLQNNTGNRTSALFMRVGGVWQWISRDPIN